MPSTKITVKSDGSIKVEGDFTICDQEGNEFGLAGRNKISLCRCGASADKPFCDGAHRSIGFQDKVVARELPAPVTKPVIAKS
jgi:CDGSH-type Zn-finger protein